MNDHHLTLKMYPWSHYLHPGHVVVIRLCWSTCPSTRPSVIHHPSHALSPLRLLPPPVPLNTITHSMTNDRPSLPRYQKAPATSKWRHFGSPVLPVLIGGWAVPLAVLHPPSTSPPLPATVPSSGGLVRGATWRAGPAWFISLAPLPGHSGRPKEPTRLQRAPSRKPGISWNKPFCRPVKNVLWLAN